MTAIKLSMETKNKLDNKKGELTYEQYVLSLLNENKPNTIDIKLDKIISLLLKPVVATAPTLDAARHNPAEEMDMERDIFKLTRTPKDKLDEAIEQIKGVYDEQIAGRIINKAMANKKEYAQQKDKEDMGYFS